MHLGILYVQSDWIEICFFCSRRHAHYARVAILVDILKFERKIGIFSCIPLNFDPHYVHCNEDLNDVA